MIVNTLTTPGIITQVVANLDCVDPAITSLFLLVNDARLRHELQPFIDIIAQYKEAKYIEDKKKEQEIKRDIIRDRIRKSLLYDIRHIDGPNKYEQRSQIIIEVFEYMCSLENDLFLVGSYHFADDLKNSIRRCIQQSIRLEMTDFEMKMKEFEIKLTPFCNFYLEHGHSEYIDLSSIIGY